MFDTDQKKPKVAPVGSQRFWESTGQVWIKTHENGFLDPIVSPWIQLPTISKTFQEAFSKLDSLGREIFRYKDPVEGDLWLDHEFEDFETRSGKHFNSSEFKKQALWSSGVVGYDFKTVLTNRLVSDKTQFNTYLLSCIEEENEAAKLKKAESGEGVSQNQIYLTADEIKDIKTRAKEGFKYDEQTRLTLDDVKDIEDCLNNILNYLKQGEEFSDKEKEVYDRGQELVKILDGTQYVSIKTIRERVRESRKEFSETFNKAWGVRQSFNKKLNKAFSKYINTHTREIEAESLEAFLEKTGVDLYADTSVFYDTLRKTLPDPLTKKDLNNLINKVVPDVYDDYSDHILRDYIIDGTVTRLQLEDSSGKIKEQILSDSSLSSYLLKVQKRDTDIDIEIPLKLRFGKLFDKELNGTFTQFDIGLCEAVEKLSSYLPLGHLKTNKYIRTLRREDSLGKSDNSYAHFNGSTSEIFFSEKAMKASSTSFSNSELLSGQSELAAVLIHEIGHAVSQKLGRRRSKEYKRFVWECGWSWEQFQYEDPKNNITRQNNYIATGNDPDIRRLGTNNSIPLISEYAGKSPEEAFAEYYSFYSQHKSRLDKFLTTKNNELLEAVKAHAVSNSTTREYGHFIHKHDGDDGLFQKMKGVLDSKSRLINDHVRTDILNPYHDTLENISEVSVPQGHIVVQKHPTSENFKEPQPVFSIFNYHTGKHTIINSYEGSDSETHYANKYLRRYSPTFTISKECYDTLLDSGYSYNQIRRFTLDCVKDKPIPEVRKNSMQQDLQKSGLLYRGYLVESKDLQKMAPIFKQMKKIWESEELSKALEDLFSSEQENDLEKALTYEYITVHPKEGNSYQRLQRKRIETESTQPDKPLPEGLSRKLLTNSVKYEGNYYDLSNGDPIIIPQSHRSWVEENYNGKTNPLFWNGAILPEKLILARDISKYQREKFLEIKDTIDKKRELYEKVHAEEERKHNKIHSPEATKERTQKTLEKINKDSTAKDIDDVLFQVRSNIKKEINPTIQIVFKGETYERDLETLRKTISQQKEKGSLGISSIKIKDLENYNLEDFNILKYNRESSFFHENAKKKVEKLLDKEILSKALESAIELKAIKKTKKMDEIEETKLTTLESLFSNATRTIKNLLQQKKPVTPTYQEYSDIVVRDRRNRVLLLCRNSYDDFMPAKWGLPGGKVDPGEDYITAAVRELEEETNLKSSKENLQELECDKREDSATTYYFLQVNGTEPILLDNEEHYHYEWVELSDLDKYDIMFDIKEKLLRFKLPLLSLESFDITSENFLDVLSKHYAPMYKAQFEESSNTEEYFNNLELIKQKKQEHLKYKLDNGQIGVEEYFKVL